MKHVVCHLFHIPVEGDEYALYGPIWTFVYQNTHNFLELF